MKSLSSCFSALFSYILIGLERKFPILYARRAVSSSTVVVIIIIVLIIGGFIIYELAIAPGPPTTTYP